MSGPWSKALLSASTHAGTCAPRAIRHPRCPVYKKEPNELSYQRSAVSCSAGKVPPQARDSRNGALRPLVEREGTLPNGFKDDHNRPYVKDTGAAIEHSCTDATTSSGSIPSQSPITRGRREQATSNEDEGGSTMVDRRAGDIARPSTDPHPLLRLEYSDHATVPSSGPDVAAVAPGFPEAQVQQSRSSLPRAAWLPPPPPVPRPQATHNAAMLAFLGDSIFELYVRRHFLVPPAALPLYCQRVTATVCAEAQDALLRRLLASTFLTPEEHDVLRWGRNASTGSRRAKSRAGSSAYANATALETLVGFLYLTDTQRLHRLMAELGLQAEEEGGEGTR